MKNKHAWQSIVDNMQHWNGVVGKDNHSSLRRSISSSILVNIFKDDRFEVNGSCVVSLTADQLKEVKL